jgi:hypothetical protein
VFDYYFWESEFIAEPIQNPRFEIDGPSELVPGQPIVDILRITGEPRGPFTPIDAAPGQLCSRMPDLNNDNREDIELLTPARRFGNCLNDFSFRTETQTWNTQGSNWAEYQKLYYDCPLAWADWIRQRLSSFYVVGIGESCSGIGALGADPYQGVGDPLANQYCRHDTFLNRLAYSWDTDELPEFPAPFESAQTMAENGRLHGEYLAAEENQDLRPLMGELYAKIARRQKIKLCASVNDAQECEL